MTKDRARKQAARNRAAITGESYVVALRASAEDQPHTTGRLHELTHKVPGVPSHVDGGLQAIAARGRNEARPVHQQPVHQQPVHLPPQHGEPKVLVAWQNWIAGLVSSN